MLIIFNQKLVKFNVHPAGTYYQRINSHFYDQKEVIFQALHFNPAITDTVLLILIITSIKYFLMTSFRGSIEYKARLTLSYIKGLFSIRLRSSKIYLCVQYDWVHVEINRDRYFIGTVRMS